MVGTKPNSGSFKKGNRPWNKDRRMALDLPEIYQEHIKGKSIIDISKELKVSNRIIRIRLKEKGYSIRNNRKEITKYCNPKLQATQFKPGIASHYPHKKDCPCFKCTGITWNKNKKFNEIYFGEQLIKMNRLMKSNRDKQIFPKKDTSIEIKIQNYLKQLGIEFYTHYHIKEIEHSYQCDILIPAQEGITRKTIIECFGNYWHVYPYGRDIDTIRTKELLKQGYRVLVFWENEIKVMQLNDLKHNLIK